MSRTYWEREGRWGIDPYELCDTYAELEDGTPEPPAPVDDGTYDFPIYRTHSRRDGLPIYRLDRRELDR